MIFKRRLFERRTSLRRVIVQFIPTTRYNRAVAVGDLPILHIFKGIQFKQISYPISIKMKNGVLVFVSTFLMIACKSPNKDSGKIEKTDFAIAYNVLYDDSTDNYEVFTMNMDGSEKKNVSNREGVEWTYYSYNDKLYFISDKDTCQRCAYYLYETNYSGNNARKISDIPLADSWMSSRNNGSEFVVRPKSDSAFYIINMEGKLLYRIQTGLPYSSDPLFVNNGKQIVFRGGLTKSKLIEGFDEELYIMNADGDNRRQLTQYPKGDTTAGKFAYKAGTPKLHPNENFISYQSKQNGKYSLYAVSLDGTKKWKLTVNQENEGWHDWSPDGKWLAIELFDDSQSQFHIGLMNWETKEMQVIKDTSYTYQQAPNFVLKSD